MASRMKHSEKGITAWLVTWEWAGEHAKPERKIAAILNPHWGPHRVRDCVEFLYANSQYSISERIDYAENRSFNAYPAKFEQWQGEITCGHNPWLRARKVHNLVAEGESDDEGSVTWTEQHKVDLSWIQH